MDTNFNKCMCTGVKCTCTHGGYTASRASIDRVGDNDDEQRQNHLHFRYDVTTRFDNGSDFLDTDESWLQRNGGDGSDGGDTQSRGTS